MSSKLVTDLHRWRMEVPMQSVVDATGMMSLDTIVAIRAGADGNGGYGYEGDTNGASIADTAQAYTDAITFAQQNGLKEIELEVNRLVPLMPSTEQDAAE